MPRNGSRSSTATACSTDAGFQHCVLEEADAIPKRGHLLPGSDVPTAHEPVPFGHLMRLPRSRPRGPRRRRPAPFRHRRPCRRPLLPLRGPLAQWQRRGLLIPRLRVRIPGGPRLEPACGSPHRLIPLANLKLAGRASAVSGTDTSLVPRILPPATAIVIAVAACTGTRWATPRTPSSPSRVAHRVYSHCGVVGTVVDGVLWLADPPLGDGNPPPGWDENDTAGSFMQLSDDRAEFRTANGRVARFRRAPQGAGDPNVGCD
jgi:hypothetical protein